VFPLPIPPFPLRFSDKTVYVMGGGRLKEIATEGKVIVVDIHCEGTSEKQAHGGRHLDGPRFRRPFGYATPRADGLTERILPMGNRLFKNTLWG